jgi:hypothetical protein
LLAMWLGLDRWLLALPLWSYLSALTLVNKNHGNICVRV